MRFAQRWPDFLLPVGIIACLMVIFVPLPAGVMDVLLAANISVAVVLLLATVYVRSPLELSLFPSLLLVTTLARLALNVGTTRLILTRGATEGELAAGGVIQAFSQFVTGDSLAVGLVIFGIIVVIQFVVITRGSTRISEVAARFTLDGLPGRQMAIDADLNAGVIDAETAQRLRGETLAQADFYGTMDGASKFVRGDAIAGVIITMINIVGGLFVGLSHSMGLGEAVSTFTRLTIGDGLASQVPALLISLAAGLLVTRSARQSDLPRESIQQVFARPGVLIITAVFLGLMVLTDLPKIPLLVIAAACLIGAYLLLRHPHEEPDPAAVAPAAPAGEGATEPLLSNDIVEMELGVGLIRLADTHHGGSLLSRITQVRKSVAGQMGIVLPKVRVKDNLSLEANQFKILIQGQVIQQGRIQPDFCLAIDAGQATQPLADGIVRGFADDHLADGPAYWIAPESIQSAAQAGYQVRSSTDVLIHQLEMASIDHAEQLLTREATKQLIEGVRQTSPAVVEELMPKLLSLSQIQQVLKRLVREGISIRPLTLILETLGDHATTITAPWQLTEQVRLQLAPHIIDGLRSNARQPIRAFTIAESLQQRIHDACRAGEQELRLDLSRPTLSSLAQAIEEAAEQMVVSGHPPIALVNQPIRAAVAQLALPLKTPVFVLGSREGEAARIELVGEITDESLRSVAEAA